MRSPVPGNRVYCLVEWGRWPCAFSVASSAKLPWATRCRSGARRPRRCWPTSPATPARPTRGTSWPPCCGRRSTITKRAPISARRSSSFATALAGGTLEPSDRGGGGGAGLRGALDVDVAGVRAARRARARRQALQQAADLYRGDLLEGLGVTETPFEEWLVAERERLRELALEALARLLAHQTRSEEPAAAVATALRLLALDPLQEAVHRALMRLYARHGRRDAALRQYQSCVDTLRRELGVEPDSRDAAALPGNPAEPGDPVRGRPHGHGRSRCARLQGPAAPAASAGRCAADRSSSPELGRAACVALDAALGGRGQLLAVLGEAGIGKSRLAQPGQRRGGQAVARWCWWATRTRPSRRWPTVLWIDALRTGGVLDRDDVLAHVASAWRAELARLFPELAKHDDQRARGSRGRDAVVRSGRAPARAAGAGAAAGARARGRALGRRDERPAQLRAGAADRGVADPDRGDGARGGYGRGAGDSAISCGAPSLVDMRLGPLSHEETMALVQSLRPPGQAPGARTSGCAEQIWAASGGNPFVIVETLRRPSSRARAHADRRCASLARARARAGRGAARPALPSAGRAAGGAGRRDRPRVRVRAAAAGIGARGGRGRRRRRGAGAAACAARRRRAVRRSCTTGCARWPTPGSVPIRRKLLHRHVAEALEALHAEQSRASRAPRSV